VGATDGLLLAVLVLVPALLVPPVRALVGSPEFRLASLLTAFGLGTSALLLGSLAHFLVWARGRGMNAIGGFAFAFFVVALVAGQTRAGDPILLGLVAGAVGGPLAGLLLKPPASRSRRPGD
jgi:hypothetical protein